MDDIKIFGKNYKELGNLIQTLRINSQNIEMEFGIEKISHADKEKGKRETIEGTELANQESIRTLGDEKYNKYLGILKADTISYEKSLRNWYLRRTK